MPYMPNMQGSGHALINSFVDTNLQLTRISVQMANVSTRQIDSILQTLNPKIKEIFPPEDYDVGITGTSVVFLRAPIIW